MADIYFKRFPKMLYDFEFDYDAVLDKDKRTIKRVTDITANVRFRRDVLSNISIYDEYDIKEGETPEIIAEKFYGSSQYHWVIMLANDRFDYRSDFPLTYIALEDANGVRVDSNYPGAASVSNRQYEDKVNESKRRIKIPSPELIAKILKDFKNEM
jgi:hypothetical protein